MFTKQVTNQHETHIAGFRIGKLSSHCSKLQIFSAQVSRKVLTFDSLMHVKDNARALDCWSGVKDLCPEIYLKSEGVSSRFTLHVMGSAAGVRQCLSNFNDNRNDDVPL